MSQCESIPNSLRVTILATAVLISGAQGGDNEAGPMDANAAARIVHRFDFDEREAGNVEDVPKYWEPMRAPNFPGFAGGGFDMQVGRSAPPSFYLKSEGRNVVYHYQGGETRVRPHGNYRIEGFIRPDKLQYARACLCAYFVDRLGRPLLETMVRTPFIEGRSQDEWVPVELHLASAPANAHTIGLGAWVLQESTWDTSAPARRRIVRNDVQGGAWFDDLVIYRAPRVEFKTAGHGNVIGPDDPTELAVLVTDHEAGVLTGHVSIEAADGARIGEFPVSLSTSRDGPLAIPLGSLPPGLFHARLDVFSGNSVVASQTLDFVRLGPARRPAEATTRSFGVVIDPQMRSDPAAELALLDRQSVRSVKLPVWTGLDEHVPSGEHHRDSDTLLKELERKGFVLTGVLFGPPSPIVERYGAYSRTLVDLLAGDEEAWGDELSTVAATYADMYRWWQVGPDGATVAQDQARFSKAAEQLRRVLRRFHTTPRLAAPASSADDAESKHLPVEQLCLSFGSDIHVDRIPDRMKAAAEGRYEQVCAFVPPLPKESYQRLPRLTDWVRRIIAARHSGANTLFVPQTWHTRQAPFGPVTEPTEEFLLLRNIADILGDATPGQRVDIAQGVRCFAFHSGEETILAAWDDGAPPEGRVHAVQWGRAASMIDAWGRTTALERDEKGRQLLRLTETPVFVTGVDRWLVDFVTSMVFAPAHVESSQEVAYHTVELANQGTHPLIGQGDFVVPRSLEVSPKSFNFNLPPGRREKIELRVRYRHNEPAGRKTIVAKMTIMPGSYYVEAPLMVDVGLSDVDVSGMAYVEGDDLVLRHTLTNRSPSVLSFRGSTAAPGYEKQYRPFANLHPGDTQTVHYRIRQGSDLIGRQVRLVLHELNDGPRVHNLELTVP